MKCRNLLWNVSKGSELSVPSHQEQSIEDASVTMVSAVARFCQYKHGGQLGEKPLGSLWGKGVPQEGMDRGKD